MFKKLPLHRFNIQFAICLRPSHRISALFFHVSNVAFESLLAFSAKFTGCPCFLSSSSFAWVLVCIPTPVVSPSSYSCNLPFSGDPSNVPTRGLVHVPLSFLHVVMLPHYFKPQVVKLLLAVLHTFMIIFSMFNFQSSCIRLQPIFSLFLPPPPSPALEFLSTGSSCSQGYGFSVLPLPVPPHCHTTQCSS